MDMPITARCALLQALRTQSPGYGRGLIAYVQEATEGRVKLLDGSAYPALDALVRDKCVKELASVPRPGGGRPARMYALTAKGRKEAEAQAKVLRALLGPTPEAALARRPSAKGDALAGLHTPSPHPQSPAAETEAP